MTYEQLREMWENWTSHISRHYKAMAIKTVWYWCGDRPKEKNGEPRHVNMDIC